MLQWKCAYSLYLLPDILHWIFSFQKLRQWMCTQRPQCVDVVFFLCLAIWFSNNNLSAYGLGYLLSSIWAECTAQHIIPPHFLILHPSRNCFKWERWSDQRFFVWNPPNQKNSLSAFARMHLSSLQKLHQVHQQQYVASLPSTPTAVVSDRETNYMLCACYFREPCK